VVVYIRFGEYVIEARRDRYFARTGQRRIPPALVSADAVGVDCELPDPVE
jgi:hypothetical protein